MDNNKLDDELVRLEDTITELQEEADRLRGLLGLGPRLTINASKETIRLLDELRRKWGDDRETALMRCIDRIMAQEARP